MNRRWRVTAGLIVLIYLLFPVVRPKADQLSDACEAYQKGAYATALWAQYCLGRMYLNGRGVGLDTAEAAKWIRMAAEQGEPWAQYDLGNMYLSGLGVPPDYVQAYFWMSLVMSRSEPVKGSPYEQAESARELLRLHMTPEQITEAEAPVASWKPKSTYTTQRSCPRFR